VGWTMFSSLEQLTEGLRHSGYIVDSVMATAVYLAATLHKPVLLEGPTLATGVNSTGTNLFWFRAHSRGDRSATFDTRPKQTSSAESRR
jgi:hypothetical protein